MLDSHLFFIDHAAPHATVVNVAMNGVELASGKGSANGSDAEDTHQDESRGEDAASADEGRSTLTQESPSFALKSSTRREPVWTDPDGSGLQVSLANDNRRGKTA